jgi:hypothetical protein
MLKPNPLTGVLEDDGQPDPAAGLDGAAPPLVDPTAPDLAAAPPPVDLQEGQGGAAPAAPAVTTPAPAAAPTAGISATSIFPTKPEHETKAEQSTKQGGLVESAATKEADAKLQAEREKAQKAQDADTEIKVREAQAKADDAAAARLALEKHHANEAYWQDQKQRKVAELMAADQAAVEASAKDEEHKNNAGILTGAAKTWATVLTAIGTIGQGLAAAGSRGAQAWADGNPIAKLYEEDRQKAQAKALADFQKSERYRALQKAGRDAELKVLEDRLTIGVNNAFKRDTDVREAILNERIAKLGPQAQRAAADLLKAGKAEDAAKIDRENTEKYDQHLEHSRGAESTDRSPTGGGAARMADDTAVFDPATGEKRFDATTPTQAKELNDNGGKMARIRSDLEKYRTLMVEIPKFRDPTDTFVSDDLKAKIKQAEQLKQNLIGQSTNMSGAGAPSGTEKADFVAALERGNRDTAAAHSKFLIAAGQQFADAYDATLPSYGYRTGPRTDLGKQAASRMSGAKPEAAASSWKGVTKTISSGTYERTGPGPNDWKKVK